MTTRELRGLDRSLAPALEPIDDEVVARRGRSMLVTEIGGCRTVTDLVLVCAGMSVRGPVSWARRCVWAVTPPDARPNGLPPQRGRHSSHCWRRRVRCS